MVIPRNIEKRLKESARTFPIVSLTGPRQSGKSTLIRSAFSDYRYVNLENPLLLENARSDPEGFLSDLGSQAVIDEAQRFPELFSYLQLAVDEANRPGMFVLSGSQNFLMMESISQSLAGRVSLLKLPPFSAHELIKADCLPKTTADWIYRGGYPRLYDYPIPPEEFYPSYIATYLQRDVRTLKRIGDLGAFTRFLQILAGRVGQMLVYQDIADAADISVPTARQWLSVLETSYIVTLLKPMHKNVTSRNVKTPKLYFWDTGLACSLLGLTSSDQVTTHYLYGALFENMVIIEAMKELLVERGMKTTSFWRNNKRQEVDLLLESGPSHVEEACEIKASKSPKPSHFATLDLVGEAMGVDIAHRFVVYDGSERLHRSDKGTFLPWRELHAIL